MSRKFGPTDVFTAKVQVSKTLCLIVAFGTIAAIVSLLLVAREKVAFLLLLPFVLLYGYHQFFAHALMQAKNACVSFQHYGDNFWLLFTREGKTLYAKASAKPFRSLWITTVPLKITPTGKRLELIVFYDSLTKKQYRHLLARLWS